MVAVYGGEIISRMGREAKRVEWWTEAGSRFIAERDESGEWKFYERDPEEVRWYAVKANGELIGKAEELARDSK
jgi:hypothetical protein